MAWTKHGHHIPQSNWDPDKRPKQIARCGGIAMCEKCSHDYMIWVRKHPQKVSITPTKKEKPMSHHLIQFFAYDHLQPELQSVSKPFYDLATLMDSILKDGSEKSTALRKLLEAKDAAVRSVLETK